MISVIIPVYNGEKYIRETLDSLLKELQFDVIEYKKKVGDDMKMSGLQNILDDFIQNINKWNYLKTLV